MKYVVGRDLIKTQLGARYRVNLNIQTNTQLFIMPIPFPVKAKWAILGFIALDVFGGVVKVQGDNIAHFAHVGGALIGFLLKGLRFPVL